MYICNKNTRLLKTLPLDFTDVMHPSIIDKYIKWSQFLSNILFIKLVANHDSILFQITYNSICSL